MGLPEAAAAQYAEMTDGVNSGWIDWRGDGERVESTTTAAHVFAVAQGRTEPHDEHTT